MLIVLVFIHGRFWIKSGVRGMRLFDSGSIRLIQKADSPGSLHYTQVGLRVEVTMNMDHWARVASNAAIGDLSI